MSALFSAGLAGHSVGRKPDIAKTGGTRPRKPGQAEDIENPGNILGSP